FGGVGAGGPPPGTGAPLPAGAAGPAAWAAGSPADSAHTTLPTAAGTRNRHFLRTFIETPSKVCRSFTAVVIDGERVVTKGRPRSKIGGPTEGRNWLHESRGSSCPGNKKVLQRPAEHASPRRNLASQPAASP